MSNKTYDILKFVALIIVPIVNFIFLVLTPQMKYGKENKMNQQ